MSVVSGVSSQDLAAINDPHVRRVMQSLADMMAVRNGDVGNGDNAFLTRADLREDERIRTDIAQSIANSLLTDKRPNSPLQQLGEDLRNSILNSPWWKDMFTRIELLQAPDTVVGSIAYNLLREAKARQASVTEEKTQRQTATESLGQKITYVTAAVGDNAAAIRNEQTARVTANEAMALQLNNMGAKLAGNVAGLQEEKNLRVNADNVVAQALNTIWGRMGGNEALVQSGTQLVMNNVGSVVTKFEQLQATVNDPVTGLVAKSAALRQEMTVTNDKIKGLSGKWGVKLDLNGYVSGVSLNAETTSGGQSSSMFIVLADKFAVGAPGVPGRVPFSIDAKKGLISIDGNLVATNSIDAGEKLIAKTITAASGVIDDFAVKTLHIGLNAVTIPISMGNYSGASISAGRRINIGSIAADYPDMVTVVAIVTWQTSGGGENTNTSVEIEANGARFGAQSDSVIANFTSSHVAMAKTTLSQGRQTFTLWFGNDWSSGSYVLQNWSVVFLGVMR